MNHIVIKNLYKTYIAISNGKENRIHVYEDFNLKIDKGEFLTIFGPNGCGKTTLLKIIAGLILPDKGSVSIGKKSPMKSDIGYIFQNFYDSLFPWRTTLENISFPLEIRGVPRKKAIKKASEFIKEIELTPLEGLKVSYPYQLSGGLQQLVAVARALIYKPNVLLMDEPFGSLDFQTRLFLQDRLLEIQEKTKVTIIFVSHEINEAIYLGKRIILLSKRPAKIKEEIHNNLPSPRSHNIMTTMEFLRLKRKALSVFTKELSR